MTQPPVALRASVLPPEAAALAWRPWRGLRQLHLPNFQGAGHGDV
ncbi:hypothetical protein [Simplicispira metamorpha]|nr:hypothetical protein [Simplicispira metamorpha]